MMMMGAVHATCALSRPRVIGQQSDTADAPCDPLEPHAEGRQSAAADAACAPAARSPPAQLHQAWELQGRQVVGEECGAEGHRQLASRVDQEEQAEQAGEGAAGQEVCVDAKGEHDESMEDAGGDSEEVVAGTPPPEGSGDGGCAVVIVHKVPTGLVVRAQLRASSPGGCLRPEGEGLKSGKGLATSLGPMRGECEERGLVRASTVVAAAAPGVATAVESVGAAVPDEKDGRLGAEPQGANAAAHCLQGPTPTCQNLPILPTSRGAAQQQQQRRQPGIARRRFVAPVLSSAAPGVQLSTSGAAAAQPHSGTQAGVRAATVGAPAPLTLAASAAAEGEAEAGAGAGFSPMPLGPGPGLNPKALPPRGLERTLVGLGIAVRPLRAEPDKLHVLDADELSIDDSGH